MSRSLSERLESKRAAEAAAAQNARAEASANYWRLALAAAEGTPPSEADVALLDATLQTLGATLRSFEATVSSIVELNNLAAQPTVDDAKNENRELRDRAAELEAKAAALRAQADRMLTEGQGLVAMGRDVVEDARVRLRKRTALSVSLRESGAPELPSMTEKPPEPIRRRVRTDSECLTQDRAQRIPAGCTFVWEGSGTLPPHLVEVDERGRPVATTKPEEAEAEPQAAVELQPVAQPAGLGYEHFSIGGAS